MLYPHNTPTRHFGQLTPDVIIASLWITFDLSYHSKPVLDTAGGVVVSAVVVDSDGGGVTTAGAVVVSDGVVVVSVNGTVDVSSVEVVSVVVVSVEVVSVVVLGPTSLKLGWVTTGLSIVVVVVEGAA